MILDPFSLATVPLEQYFGDTRLGQGTGFIWKKGDHHYLVTNWHVVAMRDFFRPGKNLHEMAARPDILRASFCVTPLARQAWDIRIRDEDDRPLWLVHPGRRVDVAVIPIPLRPEEVIVRLRPINTLANARLRVEVGMDVFVLGYPFGIEPPSLPVWKRGSIASEPQLARTTDYILVDTASRPGMSGAPVIQRSWSNHTVEPGRISTADDRTVNRFIGVYSGRLPTDHPHEAQIGLVWCEYLIDEIINGNVRDEA